MHYASKVLSDDRIEMLIESIWNFDRIPDVSQFIATMQFR